MAGLTQLYDPEFLFRSNTFTSFVITWLIRYADPKKTHPKPIVEYVFGLPTLLYLLPDFICLRLPLPKEVPLNFRVLPEHILEDVIDYLFFAVRYALVPFVISSSSRISDMDHPASS
jgi:ubiquitin conjugation factor E4 B